MAAAAADRQQQETAALVALVQSLGAAVAAAAHPERHQARAAQAGAAKCVSGHTARSLSNGKVPSD
jgi:hypothetical protein